MNEIQAQENMYYSGLNDVDTSIVSGQQGVSCDLLSDRWLGIGFILFCSILACRAVILNGSTVYGRAPVSMAYMLTPLHQAKREAC